jgi:hypothetical protein
MSTPGGLYRPYDELVTIRIMGKDFEVPAQNMLLRAMQYLAPESVAMGRFCWNEECQYCRVALRVKGRETPGQALACKLMVQPGMEIVELSTELRYCLRELGLPREI